MKTIKDYININEALTGNDKNVLTILNLYAKSSSGAQQALYKQKIKDADSISISHLNEVLNNEEIKYIKQQGIKPKECYRNAFVTCEVLETNHDVKYVEGYLNIKGLPIEHAFVLCDGKYIDPTIELALKNDLTNDTYIKLGEFELNDVRKIIIENEFWGQIYDYTFFNKYKENIK